MGKVLQLKVFVGVVAIIILHFTLSEGFERSVYGTAGVLSNYEYGDSNYTDTWTITSPIGYRIDVTIVYFTGNRSECNENISVTDGQNRQVKCNSSSPSIYSTQERVLRVIIKSRSAQKYLATFQAFFQNARGCGNAHWKMLDGSCYYGFPHKVSQKRQVIKQTCNKNGASLPSVNTKQENDLLTAMLKQITGDRAKMFIDLTFDSNEKKFVHSSDNSSVIFTAWTTPPSSSGRCVTLHTNGSWLESECKSSAKIYMFCEKRVWPRKRPYKGCSKGKLKKQTMLRVSTNLHAAKPLLHKASAWVPDNGDRDPWIEVSFESSPFLITAVATQGYNSTYWVPRFSLLFLLYDERYVNFTNPRREIVMFEGNRDAHNVAYNRLPYPLIAKTVRLKPEYHDHIGLRMKFYGCSADDAYPNCSHPLGLESYAVHDDFVTSSSNEPNGPPQNARLNLDLGGSQYSCWSASNQDTDQWLQIDFRSNRTGVTAIATQGRGDDGTDEWVTKYALSYAEYQDHNFTYYMERNLRKEFQGNVDISTIKKNPLIPVIVVYALRVHPLDWHKNISMRLEVYGCQVNGSYSAWSDWTGCTSSCSGHQTRNRSCLSSDPLDCPGSLNESRRCNIEDCFYPWTNWSKCDRSCGSGVRNRTRYYRGDTSPNVNCNGSLTVLEECNTDPCDPRSTCNMTCGIGFKTLENCTGPSKTCQIHVHGCNQTNRPGLANFTNWSNWSECTLSCGGIYYQNRTRQPIMRDDSRLLYKPEVEAKECICPRNESCNCMWSNWTECSATCGGVQTRVFNCSFTSSRLINCSGTISDTRRCTNLSCPVDGNFTEWSNWTSCTVTCGNGTKQRMRNCTNPPPSHGGNNCTGNTTETKICGTKHCPINGNFTEWSNWTNCSVTCGNGTQQRMRNCTKPPPAHGGQNCTGNRIEIRNCSLPLCPINGNFTEWSNWTNCPVTCGNGTQQRMRNCTKPPPAHGGQNCTGNRIEIRNCSLPLCPINGNFTEWSNWTNCPVTCGNGTQQRMRNCTKPPPAHGGQNCTGNRIEIRNCSLPLCPIDGNFTEWSNWTMCSVTCGNGTQRRMRYCTKPPPAHGGQNCTGNSTETKMCELQACPESRVNGRFTKWSTWSDCTRTCGIGTQERMRTCTNPPPANGGANCSGHTNETQHCKIRNCPIDGNWTSWSEWSYCNRPCGLGYENSSRSCTAPAPRYGGRDCQGPSNKSRTCNDFLCPAGEVVVLVHFTKENWTEDLKDLGKPASLNLKEKILQNLRNIYEGYDVNVTDIKIISFSEGSIVANFTIFYTKMDNLQLVILEDKLQIDRILSTMPVGKPYFNTTKVPNVSPTVTNITNHSSTSIFLSWTHVPSIFAMSRNLSGYMIFYKERNTRYLPDQLKSVTSDDNNTVVDGLKKWTDYSLRILAFTKSGNGIASYPIDFRTDEDVPSAPPPGFHLVALSSTHLAVEWDHIDPASIHGILLGYQVWVTNPESGKRISYYGTTDIHSSVENLERYTKYSVEVCGYTSKGCGVTAKLSIMTLEDAPTKPPRNARAVNLSSTSELKVSWSSPEQDGINGILRGYDLQYKIKSTSELDVLETPIIEKKDLPLSSHLEYFLTNLKSYTVYEIKIAARTNGGVGPFATIYGETCRCPQTFHTNYWFHTPYFNKTTGGNVQGIFSHIIRNMITWACADCKNGHGKTVVDFAHDGSSSKADKKSMLDVIANVHHGVQVSFPINGNKYITTVYGGHPFVPVVESPGVALLTHPQEPISPAWNILKSVINTMPFVLFSLLLAYVAGVIVWFLDSDAPEGSSFPRPFIKGASEGMWWSFISMTTVGYGDRSPTRFLSRLFAIIWTLYGMVLISIITGSVTTSLTTVTVPTPKKIYGLQVAAIENSSEHRLGILMNGKVNKVRQYHSVKDVHEALVIREVEGALIDTYVVAMDMKMFIDDNIIVTKLLNRPFGYGIALSKGVASRIEYKCRDYLQIHEKQVIDLIERSTQQLKKPVKSSLIEKSTGLFDPDSILFRNSALFVGCSLILAVLCGMTWHFIHKAKHGNKVTTSQLIERKQREIARNDLRKFVDEFYVCIMRNIKMTRERHREELRQKCKQLKRERQEKKNESDHEVDDDLNIVFKTALKLLKQ